MPAAEDRPKGPPNAVVPPVPRRPVIPSPAKGTDTPLSDGITAQLANRKPVKLDRVLGLTVSSNAALDCDPNTGTVAYPAGCVVVLYNQRKNRQTHILNASKKTITAVAISADGKYIATGECGHLPNVRVWDAQERVQVAEFTGHKYGVNCVAFSPNLKYVVSVGSQHDMIVNVWDWRTNTKVASNKVSSKVKAVAFAENGNYFVTVGNRHVKFWYLEYTSKSSKYKEPVPLMGRSAILGEQRNNYFCDVVCGKGEMAASTFSITKSGLLCEFNGRRLLERWVELRTTSANCLTVGENLIFIGCADGIVRCFSPYSLQFVTTLPRTHHLGVDVAKGLSIAHMGSHPPNAKFPDCTAITYDEINRKVTCVYNDHSIYIWDVTDIKKVGKSHSFLYHSACIWGVESYPGFSNAEQNLLPPGSFVTCSSDDTIRIWNLDSHAQPLPQSQCRRNIYSGELMKIVYVDESMSYLCDTDRNNGSSDKMDTGYDSKNGVRCIRISPDGQHLASGDRAGNVRIHDLRFMQELCKIEAHDAEVLNLEYSRPQTGQRLLASASRDRLIHVFDRSQEYAFQQTLDDHSSSITAVRFVCASQRGNPGAHNTLQMISCGADKSIIFRTAQFTPNLLFNRDHHVVGKTTLYDMDVDSSQQHILTACQDRNVRVYGVNSGKHSRTFKGALGEDGTLIKLALDNTGQYLATSCTDKNLCIYDFPTGECVATMFGHSELVTGLRFTNDCKHLISVSGDGCIFMWKLPSDLTHTMLSKLRPNEAATVGARRGQRIPAPRPETFLNSGPSSEEFSNADPHMFEVEARRKPTDGETGPSPDYRFSIGPLPLWAKKQMLEENQVSSAEKSQPSIAPPKGRWAQRIDSQGMVLRSVYSTDPVIPYPGRVPEKSNQPPMETSGELFQETEYRKFTDIRRETIIISKQTLNNARRVEENGGGGRSRHLTDSSASMSSLQVTDMDEHDGDVEDYEDDEDFSNTDQSVAECDGSDGQEVIYYPPLDDHNADGDFKVCASNPEELRQSHYRTRRSKLERPNDLPLININCHESDDDDDVATPVGGGESRSASAMLGAFSMSTESLDRVGQREQFLRSNFETLSASGDGSTSPSQLGDASLEDGSSVHDTPDASADRRITISAKYHSRSQQSPPTPIQGVAAHNAVSRLKKEQADIAWKASRNSSKSIGDLTSLPDKETSSPSRSYRSPKVGSRSSEAMRRSISMNDLSRSSANRRILPTPPSPTRSGSSSSTPFAQRHSGKQSGSPNRTSGEFVSNNMSRSSSVGTLNQGSDSEQDSAPYGGRLQKAPSVSSLSRWSGSSAMRPTISSLQKAVLARGSQEQLAQQNGGNRRRAFSQSSTNLGRSVTSLDLKRAQANPTATAESSSGETSPTDRPGSAASRQRSTSLERRVAGTATVVTNGMVTLPRNTNARSGFGGSKLQSVSELDLSRSGMYEVNSRVSGLPPRPTPRVRPSDTLNAARNDNNRRRPLPSTTARPFRPSATVSSISSLNSDNKELKKDVDIASAPLTASLCTLTAQSLKSVADSAVQLYKRVSMDTDLDEESRILMLNSLCESVIQAQQTLRPIFPGPSQAISMPISLHHPGGTTSKATTATVEPLPRSRHEPHHTPTTAVLTPLPIHQQQPVHSTTVDSSMGPANPMLLLQQYSDMLLNMMQQRMNSQS